MLMMLNQNKIIFCHIFDESIADTCYTNFHKQILISWMRIQPTNINTYPEVIDQYLTFNKKYLKVNNRMITPTFFGGANCDNLKIKNLRNLKNIAYFGDISRTICSILMKLILINHCTILLHLSELWLCRPKVKVIR